MAKKKKKRRRTPIAPPIHSAPEAVPRPGPVAAQQPGSSAATPDASMEPAWRAREAARQRAAARRASGRRRTWLIVGAIVLALVAAVVVRQVLASREGDAFARLASASGCGEIEETETSGGGDHLAEGQRTRYEESPPTHGAHAVGALPAGIYDEPLSTDPNSQPTIYQAVHSLEHGYVIIWHDELEDDDVRELETTYRDEQEVLVVPHVLERDDKIALTSWGRSIKCERVSTRLIDAFIERFRNSRLAPEANVG